VVPKGSMDKDMRKKRSGINMQTVEDLVRSGPPVVLVPRTLLVDTQEPGCSRFDYPWQAHFEPRQPLQGSGTVDASTRDSQLPSSPLDAGARRLLEPSPPTLDEPQRAAPSLTAWNQIADLSV